MMDMAVTLLPQPDSPTSPRVRPCSTEKETSSMTLAGPLSVAKLTDKSLTYRIRSLSGDFFSTVDVIDKAKRCVCTLLNFSSFLRLRI
jgi:hypothetical protein